MNWKTTHFDWNHARGFLAAVDEGSLSAAARLLGVTQPTLSRQISALEENLGVTLFERGHRSSELTDAGLELVDHVRSMFDAAARVSLTAAGQVQSVKGRVVVTATDGLAAYYLPPILKSLREVAPDIQIELTLSNEFQDLKKREADIGIRHARPEQPDLIAKLIGEMTAHFAASKDYLDRRGRPKTISELQHHDFIGFETPARVVGLYKKFGLNIIEDNIKVYSESSTTIAALLVQGLGITIPTKNIIEHHDNLEILDVGLPPFPVPVWLVTHRELHTNRRIRLVYDHISKELKRQLRA